MSLLLNLLVRIPGVIVAVTIHYFICAAVAVKLGDELPRKEGRLSLNPLKHIEPIGFIIMLISMYGWGNPVNINSGYYRNKKNAVMTVALSGIVANFVAAVLFGLGVKFMPAVNEITEIVRMVMVYIVQYNLTLGVFNLIPVYPLDGYKILSVMVRPSTYFKILPYEKIMLMILMLLVFSGGLDIILGPIVNLLYQACI